MFAKSKLAIIAAACALAAGPAIAQNTNIDAGGGKGLVVVDISNVANDIANDLSVEVADVADVGSVQIPINAAATVCNLEVNAIASSNDKGNKSCAAEATSDALNQAVQQSLSAQ